MTHEEQFYSALKSAATIKDVFDVCDRHYQLDTAKLNIITRSVVVDGIAKAIKQLKPLPKKRAGW
jgi:bifunctional pyridoxal-dependent enzyme with beta-cystathionase and maltose regulon repressor activities